MAREGYGNGQDQPADRRRENGAQQRQSEEPAAEQRADEPGARADDEAVLVEERLRDRQLQGDHEADAHGQHLRGGGDQGAKRAHRA
ncbi:MAG: hypothetical protein ACR2LY_08620 [Thermoleophilaceae bacterium]